MFPDRRRFAWRRASYDKWVCRSTADMRLPGENHYMWRRLREARRTCPAGNFAVGAIINRAVSRLAPGEAFVALGVSDGFPLLAAISGNPDKPCIGVDLTAGSESRSSARPQFLRHFESLRTADHQLHRLSFREYFAQLHELPIGCCLIGASTADDPLERLNTAEPHLAENGVVLVENANVALASQRRPRVHRLERQSVPHPARSADAPSWRTDVGQRAPGVSAFGSQRSGEATAPEAGFARAGPGGVRFFPFASFVTFVVPTAFFGGPVFEPRRSRRSQRNRAESRCGPSIDNCRGEIAMVAETGRQTRSDKSR